MLARFLSIFLLLPSYILAAGVELSWDIPTAREDGSLLTPSEISGYVIKYGTSEIDLPTQIAVEGANNLTLQLNDISVGTYYFAISTVDSDGVQGRFSDTINVVISCISYNRSNYNKHTGMKLCGD